MPPIMGAAAFIIATKTSTISKSSNTAVPAIIYLALIITHLEACKIGMKRMPQVGYSIIFWNIDSWLFTCCLLLSWFVLCGNASVAAFCTLGISSLILVIIGKHIFESSQYSKVPVKLKLSWGLCGLLLKTFHWALLPVAKAHDEHRVAVAAAGIIVGLVGLGVGGLITELVAVSPVTVGVAPHFDGHSELDFRHGLPTTANYVVMATLTATLIVGLAYLGEIPLITAHLFVLLWYSCRRHTAGWLALPPAQFLRLTPLNLGSKALPTNARPFYLYVHL